MIDRAATLTEAETDSLGKLWESGEDLIIPYMSVAAELATDLSGEFDPPMVTNQALLDAWQHALDAAGNAGRVTELDAAMAAGQAASRDVRHLRDSPSSKNGTDEAVRSAVLAVGVRDLISDAEYQTLVAPWEQVLGNL
ncbi:MAG: hypothetical protein ABIP33_11320 [Pseudolysinimonas sp.]